MAVPSRAWPKGSKGAKYHLMSLASFLARGNQTYTRGKINLFHVVLVKKKGTLEGFLFLLTVLSLRQACAA